jgi:lipopolysaccharide transport system ATP-binding protein
VEVHEVWKRFRIPHARAKSWYAFVSKILGIFGGYNLFEEFWALKNVNFGVGEGQSLGVIGRNGSGKSTLLKLIAGVMRPERGTIAVSGSLVPVLELGIGFHGELTVEENAVIYGVLMGLRRSEMKNRLSSILEFAGLERFRDSKLKNLSSGMQVRLAFSIAIQTEADVFVIDEALAVGDAEFQAKCLSKFREFKRLGKSIVLVSHNMGLISEFCEKTVYLADGEVKGFGPSESVTEQYLQDMNLIVLRARLVPSVTSIVGRCGETRSLEVSVCNDSPKPFPHGRGVFGLSYHLLATDYTVLEYTNGRCYFEDAVEPGQSVTVQLPIIFPTAPGDYQIELDLIWEHVMWFKDRGNPTTFVKLTAA